MNQRLHPRPASGFECVGIGETMIQLTPQSEGGLFASSQLAVRVAGAESTVLSYLGLLGHSVAWLSALGQDPWGDRVLAELQNNHIDVSHVVRDSGATTGVFFKDFVPGSARSVYYYRRDSAASRMSSTWLTSPILKTPRFIHTTGITSALSATCRQMVDAVLAERPSGSPTVSFDVNYRPALWAGEEAADILLAQARSADVVFVGRDEAQQLWGTGDADSVRRLLPEPSHLIVKDADIGATSFVAGRAATFVPAPLVEVVEPVGAGDSFAAGYLHGALISADESTRLEFGHALAGSALKVHGDVGPLPASISSTW